MEVIMAFEAVAYENDKEQADKLLEIIKGAGINDAVMKYDGTSQCHRIYVPSRDFTLARDIVDSWHEEQNGTPDYGSDEAVDNTGDDIYANTGDKYRDNLSSAWTFLICGIAGLAFLVVYDLGLIPVFSMATASKILFNVVMVLLFFGFLVIGVLSMRYSRKIKLDLDVNNSKNDEVMAYLRENLSLEQIDATYSKEELPQEMYYFRRYDAIREAVNEHFGQQNDEFLNAICESYLDEIKA
jgi:hypothetical protein